MYEIASLRRQLAKLERNLLKIEEQKAEYIDPRGAPLDLQEAERTTRSRISEIETRLTELGHDPAKDRDILLRPFQAPPEIAYFVGRQREVARIKEQIAKGDRTIGLCGLGGTGKTALAIHLAHTLKDEFEDGVLWTQLDATTPEAVLSSFTAAFGRVEDTRELPHLPDKAALVRQILADKHVLVVLDNAEDNEQIRWLIPSGARNTTLITTRNRTMLSNVGATVLDVGSFVEEDSLTLLTRVAGEARVSAELEAARQVIELVGGLPLALSIVAGYLDQAPDLRIAEYNDLLQDGQERLESLVDWADSDRNVAATFEVSYNILSDPVKKLFASLSVFTGPDFGVEAVAAVAGIHIVQAKMSMGRLCALSLVLVNEADYAERDGVLPDRQAGQGRYSLHSLLRLFAREKLDSESHTVCQRAAAYFSNFAQRHGKDGYHLLDLDWENIVGALQWTYKNQQWQTLVDGAQGLTLPNLGVVGFMDARGHWSEARDILTWALEGALVLNDPLSKASILTNLGAFAVRQADFKTAEQYLQDSLALLDSLPSSSAVLTRRACLCGFFGEMVQHNDRQAALNWFGRGLEELESVETETAISEQDHLRGYLYIQMSSILGRMGNLEQAIDAVEKGMTLLPESPTPAKISGLINLSNILGLSGNSEESIKYLRQGIEIAKVLGDVRRIAILWLNIGVAEEESGLFSEAVRHYQQALQLYQQMGEIYEAGQFHSNLGLSYILRGEYEQALSHLTTAIHLAETYGLVALEAFAKTNLAHLQVYQGQLTKASTGLARAHEITLQLELHILPEVLCLQAKVSLLNDDPDAALILIEESLRVAKEDNYLLAEGISWRVKGNILSAMQLSEQAVEAYRTSLDILANQDPYELAKSKLSLAQHYLTSGQEVSSTVKSLLMESLTVFEALGAMREMALTKVLLEQMDNLTQWAQQERETE